MPRRIQLYTFLLTLGWAFCEVNTLNEVSDSLLTGANIFKCQCDKNEALTDGQCVPSTNPVPVWDNVNERDFVVDISEFSSVTVNPIQCLTGFTKFHLNVTEFVIYTNGLLQNLALIEQPPTPSYCIDHVSLESGVTLVAEVCNLNPIIPICCLADKKDEECMDPYKNFSFDPILQGGFVWDDFNLTIRRDFECGEGNVLKSAIVTLPHELGASLRGYPLGSMLQGDSFYGNIPHNLTNDEYCVFVVDIDAVWAAFAQFCFPDPTFEHVRTCQNATCLRKCCPQGFIYDEKYFSCVLSTSSQIEYTFVDSQGQSISEPNNLKLTFGFPFCEYYQFDHRTSNNESDTLRFYEGGSFASSSGANYSGLNYCVEEFTFDHLDPNSTIRNSAFICFKELKEICSWRWIAGSVLLAISCCFYILILIVYIGIEELRSKMVGKCLISQVSSLLVAYLTLIFLQNSASNSVFTCNIPGTIEHLAILSAFFWLNVMCYDMWSKIRTIKATIHTSRSGSKKFKFYSLYSWGVPVIITSIRVIVDHLPERFDSPWLVRSYLGKTHCFLSGDYALAKWLYLYGPILILLIFNLAFFIHVAVIILKTKKEAAKSLVGNDSSTTGTDHNAKERAIIYLKLFVVMGISWLLEIIMYVAVPENDCYFWGLDIINMIQGVFIFMIFVCKKSTLNMIKDHCSNLRPHQRQEYELTSHSKSRPDTEDVVAFSENSR